MAEDDLHIAPDLVLPAKLVRVSHARASGPGGQNVNKLNTRVTLEIHLDDLSPYLHPAALQRLRRLAGPATLTTDERLQLRCATHRSQHANRIECIERLAQLIRQARVQPKRRKKTRPKRSAIEKRLEGKKQRGQIKRQRRQRFD